MGGVVQLITLSLSTLLEVMLSWVCDIYLSISLRSGLHRPANKAPVLTEVEIKKKMGLKLCSLSSHFLMKNVQMQSQYFSVITNQVTIVAEIPSFSDSGIPWAP